MDRLLERIEDLKRDAEGLKRTCRCGKNNDAPTLPNKRVRRLSNGILASPGSPVQNGTFPTLQGYKVLFYSNKLLLCWYINVQPEKRSSSCLVAVPSLTGKLGAVGL